MRYQIENTKSCQILGIFDGADELSALHSMAKEAGYSDYFDLDAQVPASSGEIEVSEVLRGQCVRCGLVGDWTAEQTTCPHCGRESRFTAYR